MNENVLKGMECPNCGSQEPFRIATKVVKLVWDSGLEEDKFDQSNEWGDESFCECYTCSFRASVKEFSKASSPPRFIQRTLF